VTGDILLRAFVSIPVAVMLPLGLSAPRRVASRSLLAGLIVLVALAGEAGHWQAWAIAAVAAAGAAMPIADARRPWGLLAGTVSALAVAVVVTDAGTATDSVRALARDPRVVVVASGGAAAVFIGGAVIGTVLHPFAQRIGRPEPDLRGMENAGRVIGWIERALLYGLVLVGAPGAAALVVAGKSVARFPSFSEERFAEYYVIGSLLSLAIALGTALAVRAIIGLHPVAPL